MFRVRLPGPAVLVRHRRVKDSNLLGVLYVGLGDQFDDERRLVREVPARGLALTPRRYRSYSLGRGTSNFHEGHLPERTMAASFVR
jgi:hypothetical protein